MSLRSALFLAALVTFCVRAVIADDDIVRIGAIASLSGPAGEQGRNWLQGAELAAEQISKNGVRVELLVEDDGSNPASAAAAFKKLLQKGKIAGVIGGTWDFLAAPLYPLALQFKVPFVTPTNPPEIVEESAKDNPWVFSNGLSFAASERAIDRFLGTSRPRSVAILVPQVPFGIRHAEIIERVSQRLSLKVVERTDFAVETYREVHRVWPSKVAALKPDLVFVVASYDVLDLLMREFERVKFSPIVLTTQHLDEAVRLSGNAERYRRSYGVYPSQSDPTFRKNFEQRFAHAPKVYSAEGFDSLGFLVEHRHASPPPPGAIYAGVTGLHTVRADSRSLSDGEAVIMEVTSTGQLREVVTDRK